ncbi:hypothetical protein RI065_08505 [Mycoplasmatota bacterium zrk1]
MKKMFSLILLIMCLTGCESLDSSDTMSFQEQGDFRIELSTVSEYSGSENIMINSVFTYKGENQLTIWSTPSYHTFIIEDIDGNFVYVEEQVYVETKHILEPNTKYEFSINSTDVYLPKGEYVVTSEVRFSMGEKKNEIIIISTQISFKIK